MAAVGNDNRGVGRSDPTSSGSHGCRVPILLLASAYRVTTAPERTERWPPTITSPGGDGEGDRP
jgi:hypothetical protein